MSAEEEMVLVPKSEIEKLRKLEAELPTIIEKTKVERDKERLKELAKRNKENPEHHREQSKKLYYLKRDEINAKRREAYRLKKEAANRISGSSSEPPDEIPDPK